MAKGEFSDAKSLEEELVSNGFILTMTVEWSMEDGIGAI
jgi:hypothetical protein